MTAVMRETERRAETPVLTRLQRMRQRFENTEGDRDRVVTRQKPKLTAKRKVEETVTETVEERRKVLKIVEDRERDIKETASPVEDTQGQTKSTKYPHLLSSRVLGAEGQRGGGQDYRGGVLGGVLGEQGAQPGGPVGPGGGTCQGAKAFKSSQLQPGREFVSEKRIAVIGSTAAHGSAYTNGGLSTALVD